MRLTELVAASYVWTDITEDIIFLQDTQQNRGGSEKQKEGETDRQQQETNVGLTEVRSMTLCTWLPGATIQLNIIFQAQQAEVRSVGERIWQQVKKVFLREVVKKELAGQMRSEQETSEHIIVHPTKQRRSIFSFFPRIGQRTRRRGRRPIVGTAPAAEH